MGFIEKSKARWGVDTFGFWMIMLAFSLAGSSITFVRKPIFDLLGITIAGRPWYEATGIYLLFIFPTYQVLLMIWGTLLGQGKFFWGKEKKMLLFFARLVGYRPR